MERYLHLLKIHLGVAGEEGQESKARGGGEKRGKVGDRSGEEGEDTFS